MTVTKLQENDFNKLQLVLSEADEKKEVVFLLFMAARREDGIRWCPDCVKAEPAIDNFLQSCFKKNFTFITVDLERSYFLDATNPFYTSSEFILRKVPTLMQWKKDQQLLEEDCWNETLLKSLFDSVL